MKQTFMTMLCCGIAFGQGTQTKPAFEVASVKPLASPDTAARRKSSMTIDNARVDLGNVTLAMVIALAFRTPSERVVAPDWTNDERFDIQATLPPGATKEDAPAMLQTLLAERFKLTIHHDPRDLPVYTLTVAKDGRKFHESAAGDTAVPGCEGGFHKICHKITMDEFVNQLTLPFRARMGAGWAIDRNLIDETGLKGTYDLSFDYGRDASIGNAVAEADLVSSAPNVVKELGLKLEPSKQAYDFIVVDHAERTPTEN